MGYLSALLILVGLVCAANLLLTVGVIRRLREHTAQLSTLGGDSVVDDVALPAGSVVADFTGVSIDGRHVDLTTLGDSALVGFFSPQCAACKERLPQFVSHAAARPTTGGATILAVVAGSQDETRALADELKPVATVVVESDRGPVQQAFGVTGYPAFLRIENGVVAASSYELAPVLELEPAAVSARS